MCKEEQKADKGMAANGGGRIPQLPRALKYAWGVGVTVLVGLSLVLDRGSAWMPLIHQAIDLLQNQTAPTQNR